MFHYFDVVMVEEGATVVIVVEVTVVIVVEVTVVIVVEVTVLIVVEVTVVIVVEVTVVIVVEVTVVIVVEVTVVIVVEVTVLIVVKVTVVIVVEVTVVIVVEVTVVIVVEVTVLIVVKVTVVIVVEVTVVIVVEVTVVIVVEVTVVIVVEVTVVIILSINPNERTPLKAPQIEVGLLLGELVVSPHGADSPDHRHHHLHILLQTLLKPPMVAGEGVGGEHDGGGGGGGRRGGRGGGRGREALVEFFRDERHEGVDESEGDVEADKKTLSQGLLGGRVRAVQDGLGVFEENVTQLVQPQVVQRRGGEWEVVVVKGLLTTHHGTRHSTQQPLLKFGLVAGELEGEGRGREVGREVGEYEFGGIPHLVAEEAVTLNSQHVEVNIASLGGVGAQGEPQGVSTTLGDAAGKLCLLTLPRHKHLLRVQVPLLQLLVQLLQGDAMNHVDGVNHVTQTLAHLATKLVSDHGVQVHLLEGQCPLQLLSQHHHACHPKEENVMTSLEQ